MKVIRGLSRCMLMGFILLTALPVLGASKPGATDEKTPAVMAPPTSTKTAPAQHQPALTIETLPDLVVTGVALDSACRLIVTVKNIGPGGVEPADFQRATLEITPGGARAIELSMGKLAPGTAGLRPGAEIVLTTAIVLEETRLVSVEVDSRSAIAETNARNNRMDRKLSPRCAKATDMPRGKPVSPADATGARMIKPKQATGPESGGSGKLQYFRGKTRGLAVLKPAGGQSFAPGTILTVSWADANPADDVAVESGSFVFRLRREGDGGDEACLICGTEVGRETVAEPTYAVRIPDDTQKGRGYYIRVYRADNAAVYGDSDRFNIGPADEEALLDLHAPPPCPDWVDPIHCHEYSRFRVGLPMGFTIRRSGDSAVIAEIVSADLIPLDRSGPAVPMVLAAHVNFTSAEFSWTPPAGISVPKRYIIELGYRFSHDNIDSVRYVRSQAIDLSAPWLAPDASGRNQISIRSPDAGDTVYTGDTNQLWVQWQCERCDGIEDLSYTRVLLKNGEELQRIGPTHYSLLGGSPMEFFNIFRYLSGPDYQVTIELNRFNYDTEVPEMIDATTTGNFSIVNNTIGYLSDTNPLLLNAPSGHGGASFAIGSTLEIIWTHSPPMSTTHRVRLTLTRDSTEGGGEWPIAARRPAYPSRYEWTIPADIPPGPGYRVLVERRDGTGASNSYLPFTITP